METVTTRNKKTIVFDLMTAFTGCFLFLALPALGLVKG